MRRVLATDFGIWPQLQNIWSVSDHMVMSSSHWERLANYLLLYDQIIVPTGNFQILPVLRMMLGESIFDGLVESRGIVFARFDQWFGYSGNGAGLSCFKVHDGPNWNSSVPNMGTAYFKPIDEAIADALAATNPPSTAERKSAIRNLLIDNAIQLPSQKIADALRVEAYNDILKSPYLRNVLAMRNAGRSLDNLQGIGPNQLVICTPHRRFSPGDSLEIQSVLQVAFENFLLSVGEHTEVSEIAGDDVTLDILRAKGQRMGYMAAEGVNAFAQIQKISGVPNIGAAFSAKQLSSQQIFDLRTSKHAQELRDWLARGAPAESEQAIVQRYVETVGSPGWVSKLPAKLLRFAVTAGIGAVEPITGTVLSAGDTFLFEKWFRKKSPKLFLQQAKTMLENSQVVRPPVMRGRDRNSPCSCGSGKKFKRCCGT